MGFSFVRLLGNKTIQWTMNHLMEARNSVICEQYRSYTVNLELFANIREFKVPANKELL